tara:strand:- start:102 stop:272 length:171 start_codon:yes stop_codon:yes gene_type:complete
MAGYCERCNQDGVLMFANIGGLFGMEPFCFVCDDQAPFLAYTKTPKGVFVIRGEEE